MLYEEGGEGGDGGDARCRHRERERPTNSPPSLLLRGGRTSPPPQSVTPKRFFIHTYIHTYRRTACSSKPQHAVSWVSYKISVHTHFTHIQVCDTYTSMGRICKYETHTSMRHIQLQDTRISMRAYIFSHKFTHVPPALPTPYMHLFYYICIYIYMHI